MLLRFGRLRLLAVASFLQFLSSVFLMFNDSAAVQEWMDRLVEVLTGIALGIHVPVHQASRRKIENQFVHLAGRHHQFNVPLSFPQLVTAETCRPRHRSSLAIVSYLLLALGLLVASLGQFQFLNTQKD